MPFHSTGRVQYRSPGDHPQPPHRTTSARLSTLTSDDLKRLLAYWSTKCDGRAAPRRGDIDPLEVPDLLPILHLIDVLHDPLRFRHRLVGTAVTQALGRDVTGKFVGPDLYGPATQEVVDSLTRLTTEIRPFRRLSRLTWHNQEWRILETLELPLVDDDGRVSMILRGVTITYTADDLEGRLSYEPLDVPVELDAAPA